jgi:predicted transposase YdaD
LIPSIYVRKGGRKEGREGGREEGKQAGKPGIEKFNAGKVETGNSLWVLAIQSSLLGELYIRERPFLENKKAISEE